MGDLEDKILEDCDKKPFTWWRYIDDIFMSWQHGEKDISQLLPSHNKIYRRLFTGGETFSRCFNQENKYPTCH